MSNIGITLWLLPRNAAIAVMKLYRKAISPLYGDVCRYYPSCSRYSLEAFQQQGFVRGLGLTAYRLLRCNPFTAGGIDDVPTPRNPRFHTNNHGFVCADTPQAGEHFAHEHTVNEFAAVYRKV